MTLKQFIGLSLLLSPFIGIALVGLYTVGLLVTIGAFAITALICIVVFVGLVLLQE